MRKINKVLALILALTMILPGFAFAGDEPLKDNKEKLIIDKGFENYGHLINPAEALADVELETNTYNENDEVRVIVELNSDPAIVYANERGISFENVSESVKDRLFDEIDAEQNRLKSQIDNTISMEYINSFNTVFNGFSGIVKYSDIRLIESLQGIKEVYIVNEYERPEPIETDMITSHDMIGSKDTWNLDYKGEGTTIAILDTGIDYTHRDMILSKTTKTEHTEKGINALISDQKLLGKFYTDKVPYGYNYYDQNIQVIDIAPSASMHGMHVAGTAAANGDINKGGIKGVAPEAQLLAMKVFSNDPLYSTTFGDVYLVAIDESIKLGAEVVNMSLGSTASFFKQGSPEDVAITNAVNNGVVCTISAGNSGTITYGMAAAAPNYGLPWAENPDVGVVGSPSLNTNSLSVASIENTHYPANKLEYKINGEVKEAVIQVASAGGDPSEIFKGEVEYVDCNDGSPQHLTTVAGKVALIVRGGATPNFTDKIQNAMNAGASGVIVRNHEAGGEGLINMATPPGINIPAVFVGLKGGTGLLNAEVKKVTFPAGKINVDNPSAGKMSEFTSWGTTPSLEMKPEITAPGGQIYSTLNNDKYGMMSGTSMAAPHAAGGAALVMQYLKDHATYKNLSVGEQARLAKVLLMNTANPVMDPYGTEYSVRRQGAGIMDLHGAVTTPVRVVNKATNEAKVELKDFDETKFTMNLTAINNSETTKKYNVETIVIRDYNEKAGAVNLNTLTSDYLDHKQEGDKEVTIPAKSGLDFTVTVDFTENKTIYKNMFVEGWVKLVDPKDINHTLVVPFIGFYGDWNEPKVLDNMKFVDKDGTSYFNQAGFLRFNSDGGGFYYIPGGSYVSAVDTKNNLLMSPGTYQGWKNGTDEILPYLSFLRNAETVDYRITDKDGKVLTTIEKELQVRKNYIDGSRKRATVAMKNDAIWDGTVRGKIVDDGDYFYEIVTKISYPGAEAKIKKVGITIDTVGPEVTNAKFVKETNKLTWSATDRTPIIGIDVYVNGVNTGSGTKVKDSKTDYEYTVPANALKTVGENIIEIAAFDSLMNAGIAVVPYITDNASPFIYLYQPDLLNVYKNKDVVIGNPNQVLELPDNSVIIGDKAYDRHFLATDVQAQLNLIFIYNLMGTAYIKVDADTILTLDGDDASFGDVPSYVKYYDADGNISNRKVKLDPEEEMPTGVPLYFEGYVTNFVALDRVEIDGVIADVVYVANASLKNTSGEVVYTGPAYKFTKTIYLEDGYKELQVEAISKAGQRDSIVRRLFIDDTKATLDLNVLPREEGAAKVQVEVRMTDNLGVLNLYVDGSHEFVYDQTYDKLDTDPADKTITLELELEEGDNTFVFELYDLAGNKTVKEITITK